MPSPPRPTSLRPVWGALALVVLALAPLAVSAAFGALGLVRNDDWSYHEIVSRWAGGGGLHLNGWVSMSLIGHLVLAWPIATLFSDHIAALQVWTALIGATGVLAVWWTVRRFLSNGRALLAGAVLLIGPLWGPLASSFMTDVPAFAAQAWCLALGALALERDRLRPHLLLVAASVGVGVFAATIREYAIVAPAALLLVASARSIAARDRSRTIGLVAVATTAALVYVGFFLWRRGLEGSLSLTPGSPTLADVGRSSAFTLPTVVFLALPAFAFLPWRQLTGTILRHRAAIALAASAAVVLTLAAVTTWDWSPPLLGSYLDQRGALGDDILDGRRGWLLPAPVFSVILLATLACTIAFVVVLVSGAVQRLTPRRERRDAIATLDARALSWVFVVLTLAGLIAAGAGRLPLFDRYLLGVVPFSAALVLQWNDRGGLPLFGERRVAGGLAVGAFALFGLYFSANAAAFDTARWRAGEQAVALGFPADRVDAGFEWRNVHRPDGEIATSPFQRDADACVSVVVVTDASSHTHTTELPWPVAGGTTLALVDHPDRPGCTPLP